MCSPALNVKEIKYLRATFAERRIAFYQNASSAKLLSRLTFHSPDNKTLDISTRNADVELDGDCWSAVTVGAKGTGRRKSHTHKMKKAYMKHLLQGLPLDGGDAARLVLEAVEEMPELRNEAARGCSAFMQALRRVLREGIAAVRAQEQTVSFARAAEESLARRQAAGRRPSTLRDLRYFIRRLQRVPGLAERPLRSMGTAECQRVLEEAFRGSAHNFRKGRAVMHSVFSYGIRQGWCRENPVSAIDAPHVEEKEITPLSVAECRRLVEAANTPHFLDCLPALGLMLFAGVRPGEVARLSWADVHCDEGGLSIAARHSKTGGARRVELCPPLRRMLLRQRPAEPWRRNAPLCPPRWLKRWQRLRQVAGFATIERHWVPDVLRHTFASYHAMTHRNLPSLQLQLGHRDARLLLTRYLNLRPLRRADLQPFWKLLG